MNNLLVTLFEGIRDERMQQTYEHTGFSKLDIGYSYDFEIIHSDTFSVRVEAEEGFFKNIKADIEKDTLKIEHSKHISWRFRLSRPLVRITMPDIRELSLSGAAGGTMTGFSSLDEFKLNMKGATKLEAEFNASKTDVHIRGTCNLDVKGASETVVIDANGTINIGMEEFTVQHAAVRLNGVSHCDIRVDGRLDVRLNGISELGWIGEPTIGDVRTGGISKMKKVG